MANRRTCYWYVRQDGIQSGPMSLGDLREAILRHATLPDMLVRRSDEEDYLPPGNHPELADLYTDDGGPNTTRNASPRAMRRA